MSLKRVCFCPPVSYELTFGQYFSVNSCVARFPRSCFHPVLVGCLHRSMARGPLISCQCRRSISFLCSMPARKSKLL